MQAQARTTSDASRPATISDASRPATIDPETLLAQLRDTIGRMDAAMDGASDHADDAMVNLAVSMGASTAEVEKIRKRQAEKKEAKITERNSFGARSSLHAARATAAMATAATKKRVGGWKAPQDEKSRASALQDKAPAAPESLMRCWECFPDLPPATGCDWLAKGCAGECDRPGQPMKRFLQPGPHRSFPTRACRKIYLVPLGNVKGAPPAKVFAELLRRWFLLDVEVLKSPNGKALDALERDERGCGYGPQIEAPSAHKLLHELKPRDAFIVLGYTMEDICNTNKGFGFLFGEANLDKAVGLFSFARYADDVDPTSPRFFRRCGMVLCHEALHCFGVKHCVYAQCIMNGSNSLEESESRPFACCPVDVRKLQLTLDQAKVNGKDTPPVDLVARERGLAEFFDAHGLHDDARFARGVISRLTGQPEPEPGQGEPAAAAAGGGGKGEEQDVCPVAPPA